MNNTPNTSIAFDPFDCPLTGSHLLEASAGTGKTYSLSFLYLRLLVEAELTVAEILVTTFTKAATAELGQRIYREIDKLQQVLNQQLQQVASGTVLGFGDLLSALSASDNTALTVWLDGFFAVNTADNTVDADKLKRANLQLRIAMAQFDHAQIYTIDAFVAKIFNENSNVINHYLPQTVSDNDETLISLCFTALAKANFAALGADAKSLVQAISDKSYDELVKDLCQTVWHYNALDWACYTQAKTAYARYEQLIAQLIATDHTAMVAAINAAMAKDWLNKNSYKPASLTKYSALLTNKQAYDEKGKADVAPLVNFFSPNNVINKINKKSGASETEKNALQATLNNDFDELAGLQQSLPASLTDFRYSSALVAIATEIKPLLAEKKAQIMQLTHSDITESVAKHINELSIQHRAALVDEAQDTSQDQLAIFQRAFVETGKSCFFVGDPKQAIYGFRGGDIYAFLQIKKNVQHYWRLDTNYRSTLALNTSVNYLFSGKNPFVEADIQYQPINTQPTQVQSTSAQSTSAQPPNASPATISATQPALVCVTTANADKPSLADIAATQIVELVQQGVPVSDIAVLVRGNADAMTVKNALAAVGVSVSAATKNTVYDSDEAKWLHALLSAIAHAESSKTRSLLLSGWLNYPLAFVEDDEEIAAIGRALFGYAKRYQYLGFGRMFYQLLQDYHIPANLLRQTDGKRKLTNVMQLFSLLQAAGQSQSLSLFGLIDWLGERIAKADKESELRLDDSNAVSIMTMHSAKGLQFQYVVLPFISCVPKAKKPTFFKSNQRQSAVFLAWDTDGCYQKQLAFESEAEEMRLAYVGLTRAVKQNILILSEKKSDKKSGGETANEQPENPYINSLFGKIVQTLPQRMAGLLAQPFAAKIDVDISRMTRQYLQQPQVNYQAKKPTKQHVMRWVLDSFSRMQQASHQMSHQLPHQVPHQVPHQPPHQVPHDFLNDSLNNSLNDLPQPKGLPALLSYPAGAAAGSALHEMYEYLMEARPTPEALARQIEQIEPHYFSTATALPDSQDLATDLLATAQYALTPLGFSLCDIDPAQQSIEMPFYLHLSPVARQYLLDCFNAHPAAINEIISQNKSGQSPPKQSTQATPASYLHGYIDYWFAHEGKYYVLDYKSNKLGETPSAYHRQAMQTEMLHHGYDKQALIYTAALCKYLRITDAATFNQRIGGYLYLFLRGMCQPLSANEAGHDYGIYYDRLTWACVKPLLDVEQTG